MAGILSAAQLTSVRALFTSLRPDTATRQRKTLTRDTNGDTIETWGSAVAVGGVRIGKLQEVETIIGDQLTRRRLVPALFDHGADVVPATDRCTIGGRVYDVVASDVNQSEKFSLLCWLSES